MMDDAAIFTEFNFRIFLFSLCAMLVDNLDLQLSRRGRKKPFESVESGGSGTKRKTSRRQDESNEQSGDIVSSRKTASANKLKRQSELLIEISSDEEIPVEGTGKKEKNCVASRTRSKANHYTPLSQSKRLKLASSQGGSSVSSATDGNIATLGSNIRKSSQRHHHTDSANISASRRTPVSVLAVTPETNSVNSNVSTNLPPIHSQNHYYTHGFNAFFLFVQFFAFIFRMCRCHNRQIQQVF